jgi:hypothetical protein
MISGHKKKEQKRAGSIFRDFYKKKIFLIFHFFHEKNVFLMFFKTYALEQGP